MIVPGDSIFSMAVHADNELDDDGKWVLQIVHDYFTLLRVFIMFSLVLCHHYRDLGLFMRS